MQEELTCVMDIGEQMLLHGAEVHRVEESIERMCTAMGAKRVDVFIITTSMIATVYDENGEIFTQTRRIHNSTVHFDITHRLNKLSRKICTDKLSLDEVRKELDWALSCKTYPFWLECLAYSMIAGSFTVFFGGSLIDGLISLVIGAIVRFVILFSEKAISNKIFSKFFSSLIATILAYTAHKYGILARIDAVIIGNIMTLIPGIGLTNAFRDLFTGDSISGLLRTIEAVLNALAIAAGYFIVTIFGGAVL